MYTEDSTKMYFTDLKDKKNVFYNHKFFDEIYYNFKTNPNDLLTIFYTPSVQVEINDFIKLNEIPVKNISFSSSIDKKITIKILEKCTNASHFGLDDVGALDFRKFRNLKSLGFVWNNGNIGFVELALLEKLSISKFNTLTSDISLLAEHENLKELNIFKSNIKFLNGIENLENLKSLMLFSLKDLEDLSTFKGNPNVEILDITSCKKLDVNILPNYFPNVHTLTIESQGEIATIEPLLKGFSKLKQIKAIENTKILDAKTNANYQNLLKDKRYYIKGIGTSKDW